MAPMILMQQAMRWFGPHDPVSLRDIRQAGCSGVVTALHHVPVGAVWPLEEILKRKHAIEAAGLSWTVIESLPVHESIKKRSTDCQRQIDNYIASLRHVAAAGLKVVTYNFMPVLDWMRTDHAYALPDGAVALRFEKSAFVAFDLFLLKRPAAERDYSAADIARAEAHFRAMTAAQKETLFRNAMLGLPGSDGTFTPEDILAALKTYDGIDAARLKANLFHFLKQIVPVAAELGLKLAIHPDDPPFPILGLPRVASTEQDAREILACAPSPANGLCFCTGSFGVRPDNDLPGMIQRLGERIHFLHLRNTRRDADGNFHEAAHLDGDTDMPRVMKEILLLMQRTGNPIPMRPDHGHQILDDANRKTYPGYSAIGRLKGLAELRGLELGVASLLPGGTRA